MFACRRSAGKPSRSPRTAPARCRAVRCGPRRSSSSRRSRTGTACWRARSRPYGVRCGPETGPRRGGRRQRGSASPSGTPVAGSPPASETAVPRSSNDRWRSSAPSFSDFLPNRSLRSSSLGCSSRRTCSTISADIPHIPSKFVEIVPLSHRQGNCIPYAAIRWHDFGNRPALGRPLGHFSRHPDTPLLSLSPRRRFPRPTPERVFVADHQSSSGFSGTGPSAPPPQPIGT